MTQKALQTARISFFTAESRFIFPKYVVVVVAAAARLKVLMARFYIMNKTKEGSFMQRKMYAAKYIVNID